MPKLEYDPEAMDEAAAKAAQELPDLKTAEDVAKWIRKHLMAAGYKRLCRALLKHFGV